MTDGTTPLGDDAPEAPASEIDEQTPPSPTPEVESEDGEPLTQAEEQEEEEIPEAVETEEIEFGGKKYAVPKELKDSFMMHGDYTRKTQDIAEQRRTLDQEREALAQQAATQKELIADYGELAALDKTIAQYERVDWAKLQDDDPLAAQKHWMAYQNAINTRSKTADSITTKERERSQAAQQDFAKRAEECRRVVARDIKGWSDDTARKVTEFSLANGLTNEELSKITDPRVVKLLHKAWLGDQLMQKQAKAAKPLPLKQTKPLATVKGTAPARTGLSDDLSDEEWIKRRTKELAAKRG